MTAYGFRQLIEDKGKLIAAQSVDKTVRNAKQADLLIFGYLTKLLARNQKTASAVLLWGTRQFNPRPISVRRIWNGLEENAMVLLQGAGGVGKTLTPVCWFLLDWLRDPQYTNTKFISATKMHATSNAYSDLVRMHRNSIVRLPGEITSDYIGLDAKEKKSGIQIIAIPMGDDGKGRLQGFHPHPRPKEHPLLGNSSRVRVYMDECITIPRGVWQGVDNVKVSLSGVDTIKIVGSYNPSDQTSITAINAEPEGGWEMFDLDRGVEGKNEWTSKEGWKVLRIDGKETENVKAGRDIFPGLITRDGYRRLELKDGGNSIDYYVFARGAFPPEGAIGVLISSKLLQDSRGEYLFVGVPVKCAGVDIAVDGRDNCVLTLGRTGMASGFQPKNGRLIKFKEPRMVLQADQQFTLKKGNTKIVGDEIMATCLKLGVSPENLCVDSTGNGSAVYSYLRAVWSEDVQGVDFNKPATTTKILEQDQYTPEELYEGIVTEVWFALSRWMEFGYFAIAPGVRREPMEGELTGRRYVLGKLRKLRVEKKDDYRKRLGCKSPDFADSLTLLLFGARMRGALVGSMTDEEKQPETSHRLPDHGHVDRVKWLDDGV